MEDTTCTYPTTLQATAIPTHTVAPPTPSPLGTLHLTLPVNFMQDPTNSLPLMLKCFTRQQLKPCKGRSRLLIQVVQNTYIHIWTRFRRLPRESVLNGGFCFNQVITNSYKINSEIDLEPAKIHKKNRLIQYDRTSAKGVTTQLPCSCVLHTLELVSCAFR